MTDHFTFFASYYDSVENLDPEIKASFFDMLFKYALRGEEPSNDDNAVALALFKLAKPNLDKSKAKREAGKAGGKQSGSKHKSEDKQSGSKDEAEHKQPRSDKEKEKDKEKDKDIYSEVSTLDTKRFSFKDGLIKLGVEEQAANDFMQVRKLKKASNTKTALNGIVNQIEKAGISANDAIKMCAEKSWAGFKAEWIVGERNEADTRKIKPANKLKVIE